MDITTLITGGIFCLIPIGELRVGLPIVLAGGMHPLLAYFYCVGINILVTPLMLIFLSTVNKLFLHFNWYKKLYEKLIERARKKGKEKVDKYGLVGLMIFVAIPLPLTGAYTGALGAW